MDEVDPSYVVLEVNRLYDDVILTTAETDCLTSYYYYFYMVEKPLTVPVNHYYMYVRYIPILPSPLFGYSRNLGGRPLSDRIKAVTRKVTGHKHITYSNIHMYMNMSCAAWMCVCVCVLYTWFIKIDLSICPNDGTRENNMTTRRDVFSHTRTHTHTQIYIYKLLLFLFIIFAIPCPFTVCKLDGRRVEEYKKYRSVGKEKSYNNNKRTKARGANTHTLTCHTHAHTNSVIERQRRTEKISYTCVYCVVFHGRCRFHSSETAQCRTTM